MTERKMRVGLSATLLALAFLAFPCAWATGNIDPASKYAWGENIGWVNAAPTNGGITVHFDGISGYLTGHAWGENIGWIVMGSAGGGPYTSTTSNNWGVNVAADGKLSGYAWGENVGWINFEQVYGQPAINFSNGEFSGHAWGANIGWVTLRGTDPDYGIKTLVSEAAVVLGNLSQTYNGTARNVSVTTTPTGVSVDITYDGVTNAPVLVGSYAVTGTVNYTNYYGTGTGTLTITKAPQAISFDNPGTQFWTNTVALSATASSSGTVTFAVVSGPASLTSPTSLSMSGYGMVTLTADQVGSAEYEVASTVTNSFAVVGPQLAVLGTNGAVVESSASFQLANGTHFGEALIGLDTVTNVFAITNSGNATLTMGTYETNGMQATSFTLLDVPSTLASGAATNLTAVFDPQLGGSNTASFVFSFDGTNSPYTVNVVGIGLGGGISLATNALSFTGTFAGGNPEPQMLGMTNVGDSAFAWTNTIAYSAGASNWLSVLPGSGTVLLAGTVAIPNVVDLSGVAAGMHSALVTLAADATNSPQTYVVALTVGRAEATVVLGDLSQTYNGTARYASATTTPAGLPVDITYDGVTNAPVLVDSYAVTGTVNHANYSGTGTGTLTITKASQAISFDNPGTQFWTNTVALSATASSGGTVTFAVFSGPANLTSPTSLTMSGYGMVTLTADQAGSSDYEVAPTVTNSFAVVGPQLAVLGTNGAVVESSASFQLANGTHFGLDTATNVFAITNTGNATLTMGTYETNGMQATSFTLLDVPATLASGVATNLTMVFDPLVGGSNTASFVFSFDGTNSPYTVNVAGIGLGGDISLVTNVLRFTGTFAGGNPEPQMLGMTNVGVSAFTWTNTIAYGAGASNWLSVLPSCGSVPLAGTVAITNAVDLSGIAAGMYSALVTLAANATNSPQVYVVALTVGRAEATVVLGDLSQTYNGTARYASATTTPAGLPVDITYDGVTNAPVLVDSYAVTGTVNHANYSGTGTGTLFIAKADQAISFPAIPPQSENATYGLSATGGGSGNAITFVVDDGPGEIFGDTNLSFTGVGAVVVVASQAGDANYNPAPAATNVVKVFCVIPDNGPYAGGNSVVVSNGFFGTITNVVVAGVDVMDLVDSGTNGFTIVMSAATNVGLVDIIVQTDTGEITLSDAYTYNPAGEISGLTPASGSWTGNYEVVISGTNLGNGDITNVTLAGVSVDLIVSQSMSQVVVVAGASNSGLLGDVRVYSTSYGETVMTNAFEYLRTAQGPLVFTPVSPQVYGSVNALSVSGGSGTGSVSYVVSSGLGQIVGNTNLLVTSGTSTVTVVATKAQDDLYFATSATGTVQTAKASQTITFPNPGMQIVTNETLISATASSGLPVSFSVVSGGESVIGPIAPISPIILRYVAHGLVTLEATQAGNADWLAASAVEVTFRVRADRVPYADFDGDGRSDLTVYLPEGGLWYIRESTTFEMRKQAWGWFETVPVPGDYDGDGITDIAVYWPHDGVRNWFILQSSDGQMKSGGSVDWGWSEVVPVPGDYDGDGMTDIAVYWPGGGNWYIRYSGGGTRQQNWGWSETVPVPGDYDGDGITDIAVYWPNDGVKNWFILQSSDGQMKSGGPVDWGWSEVVPVPGDYDGDGMTDIAVYWPEGGNWYIRYSGGGTCQLNWGWNETIPVPSDYDGDGITDIAVYWPHDGVKNWFILKSSDGQMQFGGPVDWGWSGAFPTHESYWLHWF